MARIDATKVLTKFDHARAAALAGNVEGIHDLRVCARRLRVWARFAGEASLADELRWVCRSLSALRDLDVVDAALTDEARALLRPPAIHHVRTALASARCDALRSRLDEVKPPKVKKATRLLEKLEARLHKRSVKLEDESLHAWRRALREVRHTREWLGLETKELEHAQRWLGALNDLNTLLAIASRRE